MRCSESHSEGASSGLAMRLEILESNAFYARAAALFAEAASAAVAERGRFTVALSGGNTPLPLYDLLADQYAKALPWAATRVFFGDERCVPPDHPDSNYRVAEASLLSRVPLVEGAVHRMKGELDPAEAACDYERALRSEFGERQIPDFDLLLLGVGPDGHIASLFPHTEALCERKRIVVANFVAKLATYRLTLTIPVILNARLILVLARGLDKAVAVNAMIEGPYQPEMWPVQVLQQATGELLWLVDPEAATMLSVG